jgi:hypothetical protein
MNWIDLTPVRDRWQTLITAVINNRVLQDAEDFLTS